MDYRLQRSRRRRTLGLRITPDGQLVAYAPWLTPRFFVDRFVRQHEGWVDRQRQKLTETTALYPPRQFIPGELFHLWGQERTLRVLENPSSKKPTIVFSDQDICIEIPPVPEDQRASLVQEALRRGFQKETEARLPELIEKNAALLGAQPVVIKVVEQKRRWGSCSRKGSLRFNWRLSMFPAEILEYVVVHELAHLKVHNHSPRFWATVAIALPDYKLRQRALRLNAMHVRM